MSLNYNTLTYLGPMLVNHGGKCCGIKTIWCLGYSPGSTAAPIDPWVGDPECGDTEEFEGYEFLINDNDVCGYDVDPYQRFFTAGAPKESNGERVERYIRFVKKFRPKHLIEVAMVDEDQPGWKGWFEERGFKLVSEFRNSNSGNKVKVYHLVVNEEN